MTTKRYPMSMPHLISKVPRSEQVCKKICSLPGISYHLMKRKLTVQWEINGPSLIVPPNCAHPLLVLMHQHGVYAKMFTGGEPKVKEGNMNPDDLELYVSVAAYLRDLIYAFQEEWEGEGYKPKFRSARLEFHMAMVLTGGTFNDLNVRKVKKRFNVTWNDFVERVEVTDVMKLNGDENAYHSLICGKDENMCGLDDFPSIKHSKESSRMIERFITEREAAWANKHVKPPPQAAEQQGSTGNAKDKKTDIIAPRGSSRGTKGRGVVRNTREKKKRQEGEHTQSKHVIQNTLSGGGTVVEEDVPAKRVVTPTGQGNIIGDTQHALERLGALDISSQSTYDAPHALRTRAGLVHAQQNTVLTAAGIRRTAGDGVLVGPNTAKTVKPTVTHVYSGTKPSTKGGEGDTFGIRSSTHDNSVPATHPQSFAANRFDLMHRAVQEGNGSDIACNLLVWMVGRYRLLVGVPLEDHFNGQLIPQSPDEYHDLTEHDYLEALGIERLYAALLNAEKSPGHLIHLAHALGRAAKETNILSDSKPDTVSLEPLPPITLPRPIPSHMGIVSSTPDLANEYDMHPDLCGETADNIRDGDDGSVFNTGRAADESAPPTTNDEDLNTGEYTTNAEEEYVSDDLESASHIAELQELHALHDETSRDGAHIEDYMNIDTLNATADSMVTGAASGGYSAEENGNLRDGRDGDGKRKRTDSLVISPSKVLLLPSLNKTTINLTNTSYQADNERGNTKRSKPLSNAEDVIPY